MKKTFKLLALLSSVFVLASCTQPEPTPSPDDDGQVCDENKLYTPGGHLFDSVKIEHQYRNENADYTLGGYLSRSVSVFKDVDSLLKSATPSGKQTFYSMWTYHNETENFGFDPFLQWDEEFFKDHILIVGGVDLPKDTTLYFGGLTEELEQNSGINGGNPYHSVLIDEVSPTDEVQSVTTERPVYFFIPVEIPEGETVDSYYAKYKSDSLIYLYWKVAESTLTHCYDTN